jgi:GT2 family glycosyltransferase
MSSMSTLRVSIIVVNWNGLEHLPTCLDSLQKQSFCNFETILVDNGSSDGSLELMAECYPWVKVVRLASNTGFSGGNNEGLKFACGEYIVVLNNDTEAEPDWLTELVATADAYPDAGQVGCRICSMDDHDRIDSLGHGVCPDGMTRGRFRMSRWAEVGKDFLPVDDMFFGTACVSLYRKAALNQVGFFDDDMFAFAEDSDLGLRLRWGGWRAIIATKAVVYHKYSGTGGIFSPFKLYLVERNHYWVALKNFPLSMLLLVPFYTVIRYLVQIQVVLSGKGSGGEFAASGSKWPIVRALLKGTWDALLGMPLMLAKRRLIIKSARITPAEMRALMKKYRMSFHELLDVGKTGTGL